MNDLRILKEISIQHPQYQAFCNSPVDWLVRRSRRPSVFYASKGSLCFHDSDLKHSLFPVFKAYAAMITMPSAAKTMAINIHGGVAHDQGPG